MHMKNSITPLIVAIVLLAAGWLAWSLGAAQDRIARAKSDVATLEFGAVAPGGREAEELDRSLGYAARLPILGAAMTSDANNARVTAAYWLERYDALVLERDAGGAPVEHDPDVLLLAANAGYRASRLAGIDHQTALGRLDTIIRNYGDVLKSNMGELGEAVLDDAAYNYEFAVRTRDVLERAKANAPTPVSNGVPPPSIHGHAGGPPKNVDANKFKIVVPRRSDERDNNPEGGQGQQKLRRG
jgi:hypothetical protein